MNPFDSSPLGLKYSKANTDLITLLGTTSSTNSVNIQTLMTKNNDLYTHSTNLVSNGLKRVTSATNCVSSSDLITSVMNALIKTMSDIINGISFKSIFDAISNLMNLVDTTLTDAISAILTDITNSISVVLNKTYTLGVLNELSSDVSKLLTVLTGMLSCSHDSLLNSDTNISSLLGYVDPNKRDLLDHIKTESTAGKSLSEIQSSSKLKIADQLGVTSKMNNALSVFGQ